MDLEPAQWLARHGLPKLNRTVAVGGGKECQGTNAGLLAAEASPFLPRIRIPQPDRPLPTDGGHGKAIPAISKTFDAFADRTSGEKDLAGRCLPKLKRIAFDSQ